MTSPIKKYWKPITAPLIFLISQVILGGVFIIVGTHAGMPKSSATAWGIILSGLFTVALCYSLRMIRLKTFSVKKMKWKRIPLALAAALTGILAMNLLGEQLELPDMMKEEFNEMAQSLWGIIAIVLVGPIVEELVFREAIIASLLRHRIHRKHAILISALAFGIIHINPAQMVFAFAMGIILGAIYAKTGNIVITSLIHIVNNSLAIIEMKLLGERIDEIDYSSILGGTIVTWGYIFVSIILCIIFLSQFWQKYHRQH